MSVEVVAEVKAVGGCCCRFLYCYDGGVAWLWLRTSAGKGRRGIGVAGNSIRRTDIEGYVEGFELRFVVSFFGAPAEVGRVVPLRVTLEARV